MNEWTSTTTNNTNFSELFESDQVELRSEFCSCTQERAAAEGTPKQEDVSSPVFLTMKDVEEIFSSGTGRDPDREKNRVRSKKRKRDEVAVHTKKTLLSTIQSQGGGSKKWKIFKCYW